MEGAAPPHAATTTTATQQRCAFCGGDAAAHGGRLGRMQGPFFTSSKGHDAVYVHHECALWSPQITVDVWHQLQSVVREVRRARNLKCSVCGRHGASLGCRVPSCSRCFHLPCAIQQGCWFNFELYLMSCQEHSGLFKKEPAGRQQQQQQAAPRAVAAGPLRHLKLSSRHLQLPTAGQQPRGVGRPAAAAAGGAGGGSSSRSHHAASSKRNRMSAEELGSHMAAAEEAYLGLVEELSRAAERAAQSSDDEAVFARKNAKRFRKAEQLLAPVTLQQQQQQQPSGHQQPQQPGQQQPGQQQQQYAGPLGSSVGLLPAEGQARYLQHLGLAAAAAGRGQQGPLPPTQQRQEPPPPQDHQQQQHSGAGAAAAAAAASGGAGGVCCQPSLRGFSGVGGLESAKCALREMVLLPLTYPHLYSSMGIQPPRGILLYGPPGTGKTALVRALAAECAALTAGSGSNAGSSTSGSKAGSSGSRPPSVSLFARKGTDCLGKYAGDAELHLRMLFEMAASAAPSIIFLDELDGLVPARSTRSGGSDQIFASIVSVLLALMDGLTDRGQVLVIGATNRPDNIDQALRRPGRFDREVHVGLPPAPDRASILALHTAAWTPQPSRQLLTEVAAQTEGWAGADLQSLAASALMAAIRRVTPMLLHSMEVDAAAAAAQQQQVQEQEEEEQEEEQAEQQAEELTELLQPPSPAAEVIAPSPAPPPPPPPPPLPAAAGSDGGPFGGGDGAVAGGFLAALQQFAVCEAERPAAAAAAARGPSHSSSLDAPLAATPQQQQQQQPEAEQQQQQSPVQPAHAEPEQEQQQEQPQQREEPLPPLPPRAPKHRGRRSSAAATATATATASRPPAAPPAALPLPAGLASLQVLPCDWQTALAELGPPASKRGTHNLPALSPAAPLAWPLLPLLLPGLVRVVQVLVGEWGLLQQQQGRVLLASGGRQQRQQQGWEDAADWQQAMSHSGDSGQQVSELLASWGVVEAGPGSESSALPAADAAPGRLQRHHSSNSSSNVGGGPHCLLLSGHRPEGQSEVAAAALRLLEARAGAAVYALSLPVMVLLGGEGGGSSVMTGAGLVAGVREALGGSSSSSSTQPLVLFMPRIELWALEAGKPSHTKEASTAAAATADGSNRSHYRSSTLGSGWCSGLGDVFGSSSSSDEDEEGMSEGDEGDDAAAAVDQSVNNNSVNNSLPGGGVMGGSRTAQHPRRLQRKQGQQEQQREQQEPELQLSAAWSVFEQQLAMLHTAGQQRQLLVLATTHLPVQGLPAEVQQVFGWQQQQGQGRQLDTHNSCSRTVQVCAGHSGVAGGCCGSTADAGAALQAALDRAVQLVAATGSSSSASGSDNDTAAQGLGGAGRTVPQQQQPAVDALMHAALQQRRQQERQERRRLPARVPTQQVLAVRHMCAPFEQLNAAQQAEAQALCKQVQASLQHIASAVLHDPRLPLTRTSTHARTRQQQGRSQGGSSSSSRGPAASILSAATAATSTQQQRQQMLAAAVGLAPRAVADLEAVLPLAGVCVKALRGWCWHLDHFQAAFAAAAATVRSQQPAHAPPGVDGAHSCSAAAASTLEDVVAAACHEARMRLRLYDSTRLQLLEAAALHTLSGQQRQSSSVPVREARAEAAAAAAPPPATPPAAHAVVQEQQQEQQQVQPAAGVEEVARGREELAALCAAAATAATDSFARRDPSSACASAAAFAAVREFLSTLAVAGAAFERRLL